MAYESQIHIAQLPGPTLPSPCGLPQVHMLVYCSTLRYRLSQQRRILRLLPYLDCSKVQESHPPGRGSALPTSLARLRLLGTICVVGVVHVGLV
jgi:hypothetical protein